MRKDFKKQMFKELQINQEIRADKVRLIGIYNEQIGIKSLKDALELAEKEELDLIMVQPNADPPVCRISDYGKYKYEQLKKEKEAKKKQTVIETKEIKISPNIEEHDLLIKVNQAKKFINKGYKVKVTLVCKGREITHLNTYKSILLKFIDNMSDVSKLDTELKTEGKNLFAMLIKK